METAIIILLIALNVTALVLIYYQKKKLFPNELTDVLHNIPHPKRMSLDDILNRNEEKRLVEKNLAAAKAELDVSSCLDNIDIATMDKKAIVEVVLKARNDNREQLRAKRRQQS